jgi:hypothetical protein
MASSKAAQLSNARRWARQVRDSTLRGNEPLWRYAFNLPATVRHARRRPELGPVAREVQETLRRDGVAVTTLDAITGDPTLLPRLQAAAAEAERLRREKPLQAHLDDEAVRPFLIQMLHPSRPEVDPRGVFAEVVLDPQIKGVVDTYFRMTTRVSDLNVWRNAPNPAPGGASTQLWHRDLAEDFCIVKVFVYLEDVPVGGGPFTYARGSHLEDARRADQEGMAHDGVNYRVVATDRLEQLDRDAVVCTGPAGTVVIADVRGLHRGGLAVTRTRFMMQARYTSATVQRYQMLAAPAGVDPRPYRHQLLYDRSAGRPAPASASAPSDEREPITTGQAPS